MEMVERLRAKLPALSPSERKVAQFLLEAPLEFAFRAASDLASRAGVSEATVIRFARSLGYAGYADLRQAAQAAVRADRYVNRGLLAEEALRDSPSVLHRVMRLDMRLIAETLRQIDERQFTQAVDRLLAARQIAVVGLRTSAAPAIFLGVALHNLLGNAAHLDLGIGDLVDQVANLTPDDVVVAFSFARYTRQVVEFVDLAAEQGVPCIVVTDHPLAPATARASLIFVMQTRAHAPVDSPVATFALCNALLAAVTARGGERVRRNLEMTERLTRRAQVFTGLLEWAMPAGPGDGATGDGEGQP